MFSKFADLDRDHYSQRAAATCRTDAATAGPDDAQASGSLRLGPDAWRREEGRLVEAPRAQAVWEPGHWAPQSNGGYVRFQGSWRS